MIVHAGEQGTGNFGLSWSSIPLPESLSELLNLSRSHRLLKKSNHIIEEVTYLFIRVGNGFKEISVIKDKERLCK